MYLCTTTEKIHPNLHHKNILQATLQKMGKRRGELENKRWIIIECQGSHKTEGTQNQNIKSQRAVTAFFSFLQKNTLHMVKFTVFANFDSCILQYNHYYNQDILVEWFYHFQDFLILTFYSQSLNSNLWQPHTHSLLNLVLSLSTMHLKFIHVIVCISN